MRTNQRMDGCPAGGISQSSVKNLVAEFAVTKLVNVFDACSLTLPEIVDISRP